ncbi:hypothetical protein F2Q70_00002489 [Brassica cretica]|uniref:Uncharacterized protein n=1 Tax=Brassica cretica TaxID=69181 RepID=A0A8S9IUI5_BRACR|nr:hypothetical protein F2Q70_00002489 [Brassica cretica]
MEEVASESFVVSQKKDPSLQVQLLEYDMRFERYGNPPYLSKECLERVTQTVSFLASPVGSLLLLLTAFRERTGLTSLQEMRREIGRLSYWVRLACLSLISLANSETSRLFVSYDPGTRLGGLGC